MIQNKRDRAKAASIASASIVSIQEDEETSQEKKNNNMIYSINDCKAQGSPAGKKGNNK